MACVSMVLCEERSQGSLLTRHKLERHGYALIVVGHLDGSRGHLICLEWYIEFGSDPVDMIERLARRGECGRTLATALLE